MACEWCHKYPNSPWQGKSSPSLTGYWTAHRATKTAQMVLPSASSGTRSHSVHCSLRGIGVTSGWYRNCCHCRLRKSCCCCHMHLYNTFGQAFLFSFKAEGDAPNEWSARQAEKPRGWHLWGTAGDGLCVSGGDGAGEGGKVRLWVAGKDDKGPRHSKIEPRPLNMCGWLLLPLPGIHFQMFYIVKTLLLYFFCLQELNSGGD